MMSLFADDFVSSGNKVLSKAQIEEAVKSNFTAHNNSPNPQDQTAWFSQRHYNAPQGGDQSR